MASKYDDLVLKTSTYSGHVIVLYFCRILKDGHTGGAQLYNRLYSCAPSRVIVKLCALPCDLSHVQSRSKFLIPGHRIYSP